MTLVELSMALEHSFPLDRAALPELTLLAVRLRKAGVVPTLENCADTTSLAAWIASAEWVEDPMRVAAESVIAVDGGESIYVEAARALVEGIE